MNGATSPSLTAASPKRPRKPKGQKQSSQLRGSSTNNNNQASAPLSPAGRSGGGGGASSRAAHAATRQQPQSPVRSNNTNRPSAPSRTASYSPGGTAPQRQFTQQQQQPNSPKRGVKASFSERSPNGRLWKRPQHSQSQQSQQPHSPTRSSSTTQKNAVRASPMRQASSSQNNLKSSGISSSRPAPEAPPPLPAVPFDGSSSSLNFNVKSSSSSSPPTPKQPQKARKPKTSVVTTTTTSTAAAVTSAPAAAAPAPPSPTKPTVAFEQPSALPSSKRGPLSTEKALSSILDEESESSKFPTNNSKRRVEGQRDGIAFIIVVDAPATHGGKWFQIVKATLLRPGEDDSDTDEEKAAAAAAKKKAQPPRSQKATLRKKKPGAGSAPSSPLATSTPLQVPSSAPANMTLPKLTPALAPPVRSKNPPPKKPNSRPNSRPTSPVRTTSSNNLNSRPTSPVRTTSSNNLNSRPTSPARSPKQKKATAAAAAPANVRPPARYPSTMTAASDILDDDDDYYQDNDNDRNGGGNARYDDQDLTYRLPGTSGGNNNANNNKTKFSSAAVLARMQQRSALDRSSSAESTRSSGNGDEDIEGSAHLPMTNIDDIYADAAQPAVPNKKMITRSETFEDYDDHDYAMDDFDDDDSESESVDEDDSESLDEVDSDDDEDDDDDLDLLDKSPVVLRTGDMDRSLDVMAVLTGGTDDHLYEFKGNEEAVYEFKDDSKKNLSPSRWGENKPAGGAALRRPSGIPGTSPTATGGAPGFSTKLRRPSGAVAQKPYSPPSGFPAATGSGIRGSDKDSNARFGTSSAMMKKADPQSSLQVSALNSTGHSIDAASLYNSSSNLPQRPATMIPRESFSSESSSSAYSFGVNVPGDGGSLLDQANTASYMQFSIVSEDGLYMVESGLPDSEHTRKLVDAGTADKPPPGPPAESKKMSPRPEAARKPDKAKDGAPSMPARAAEALRNKMNKRSQGLLRGLQKETQQGQFQQQQQQLSQPQQSQARDVSKRGVRRTTSNREGGPLRGLVRTLSSREVPSFFPNRGASRDNADRNRKGEVDTSRGNSVERGPIRGVMRTFSNNRRDESVERGRGLMRTFSNNNKAGNSKASRKQAASAPNTPVADKKQGFFSFASTAVGNSLNASFGSLSRDGASLLSDSSGDDDF